MSGEILDHEAARHYAAALPESNLARCYLDLDRRMKIVEAALNPRQWSHDMSIAWGREGDDTFAAFDGLRAVAFGAQIAARRP